MSSKKIQYINYDKRSWAIIDKFGNRKIIPPCGERLKREPKKCSKTTIDNVKIKTISFEIKNMPFPKENTIYLVPFKYISDCTRHRYDNGHDNDIYSHSPFEGEFTFENINVTQEENDIESYEQCLVCLKGLYQEEMINDEYSSEYDYNEEEDEEEYYISDD